MGSRQPSTPIPRRLKRSAGKGATRSLPAEAVERFFAVGFAFEQMHRNLRDLERCVTEWADAPASSEGDAYDRTD